MKPQFKETRPGVWTRPVVYIPPPGSNPKVERPGIARTEWVEASSVEVYRYKAAHRG